MRRSLNRSLNHRLNRYATSMLDGRPRPRDADGFAEIFQCFRAYFKVRDRMALEDPHLFGPEAARYYRETVAEHHAARQIEAALDRVYGPSASAHSGWADRVWSDNYPTFQSAAEKQKWVKNWSKFRH